MTSQRFHRTRGRVRSTQWIPLLVGLPVGESEAKTNTGRGVFHSQTRQSPVGIRKGLTAKSPRNRGDFSGSAGVRAGSLCTRRLNGGGRSRSRTRLRAEIPDLLGKCREISANEHGFPPGRCTQGRERRSCQPPVFWNRWRFEPADFSHTTGSAQWWELRPVLPRLPQSQHRTWLSNLRARRAKLAELMDIAE
jgi:hypothetical protein